ncbi:hypothetical protein DSL92_06880 [Billgrantia gudaonensis]|uniref:Uncharacterized protein n=1 Tax=Billgrantia gudaonensis TaxID=376427 RepID=A0A432JH84_9GAMM|nr:hypothetical protein DSL92_06880 [Halomonas gudaonensis]
MTSGPPDVDQASTVIAPPFWSKSGQRRQHGSDIQRSISREENDDRSDGSKFRDLAEIPAVTFVREYELTVIGKRVINEVLQRRSSGR